jgi:hypothetical protein
VFQGTQINGGSAGSSRHGWVVGAGVVVVGAGVVLRGGDLWAVVVADDRLAEAAGRVVEAACGCVVPAAPPPAAAGETAVRPPLPLAVSPVPADAGPAVTLGTPITGAAGSTAGADAVVAVPAVTAVRVAALRWPARPVSVTSSLRRSPVVEIATGLPPLVEPSVPSGPSLGRFISGTAAMRTTARTTRPPRSAAGGCCRKPAAADRGRGRGSPTVVIVSGGTTRCRPPVAGPSELRGSTVRLLVEWGRLVARR